MPSRRRASAALVAALLAVPALAACRDAAASPATSAPSVAPSGPTASSASSSVAAARVLPPTGTSRGTLTSGGRERTYRLHRPPSVGGSGAVPLVVMLHGGLGSAEQAQEAYGWDAAARRHGFLVVYPDGYGRTWNVGGTCCGPAYGQQVDDVAFLRALVADLTARLPVDPRRVYATGMSNGGMMAYRLACDTRLFAAIGPVAATMLGECRAPSPVSVIHVHGTADDAVRYDGRPAEGLAHIDGPAVPALVATWRATDRCGPPSVRVRGAVTTSSATCRDGRAVRLVTVADAGHQWPGARPRTAAERFIGLAEPSDALDATEVIWNFLAAHPRP